MTGLNGKSLYSLIAAAVELNRSGDRDGLKALLADARGLMPLVRRLSSIEGQLKSFGSPGIEAGPTLRHTWENWLQRLLYLDHLCRLPSWSVRLARLPHGGVRRTHPSLWACMPTPN